MERPSKTEVARFLNDHGREYPDLTAQWAAYLAKCSRAGRTSGGQFGYWLQMKHPEVFNKMFRFFQTHKELVPHR